MASKQTDRAHRLQVEERAETEYRHYRIIAGRMAGVCQAIAYAGNRKVAAQDGKSVDQAVSALEAVLEERLLDLRRERVHGIPTEIEFREAMSTLQGSGLKYAVELLTGHSRLPHATATPAQLARLCDGDQAVSRSAYERLGRRLATLLEFSPQANGLDRSLADALSFAEIVPHPTQSGSALRLRPEVIGALRALGAG